MLILGLDSSAQSASCAVFESDKGKLFAYAFANVPATHSETLLPLTESVLKAAKLTFADIDAFAVTNGPGSFTGLRIGVSAVKGMAFALNKPVCGVSTLLALAHNLVGGDMIACAVMDARRGEFYNALFDISGEEINRLTPDRAIRADELGSELAEFGEKRIVFVGDGAEKAHDYFDGAGILAPEIMRYQNAASACMAAKSFVSASELAPIYIRKPQAERERLIKEGVFK